MSKRFERFAKMAKEEFGCTVIKSDRQETFEDVFNIKLTENYDNNNESLQIIECGAYLPMDDYAKKRSLD